MAEQVAIRIVHDRKIVCPWKFVRLPFVELTYGQLWHDILDGPFTATFVLDLPCRNFQFKEATASTALLSTENVKGDGKTDLIKVVNRFGMYFFSIAIQHLSPCATCLPTPVQPPLNAFNVLMASARDVIGKDIPKPVHDPKSNMDRLRNKVLSHFEEKGCIFPKNSGKGACSFVSRLCSDDLNLPHGLQVFVKDHDCLDHIEKLYYTCGHEPCCIQCGEYLHGAEDDEDTYPQCEDCLEPLVQKRH